MNKLLKYSKKYKFYILILVFSMFVFIGNLPKEEDILDDKSYTKIRDHLVDTLNYKNPRYALDELTKLTIKNKAVLRSCHALAHELGDNAYYRYHNIADAMIYNDDICGSGYTHGVIESYFENFKNTEEALKTVCLGYTEGLKLSSCYHGVGHGLMFNSDDDLPKSIKYCDKYLNMSAKIPCAEGVFMENFNTDQKIHYSKYLDESNPFSICNSQTKPYFKGTCYFYAPLYYLNSHITKYKEAFSWCNSAESSYKSWCIKGVASRMTKENMQNIKYAENICMTLDTESRQICASGIGSYHLTHYSNPELTQKMCLSLNNDLQISCLKEIN